MFGSLNYFYNITGKIVVSFICITFKSPHESSSYLSGEKLLSCTICSDGHSSMHGAWGYFFLSLICHQIPHDLFMKCQCLLLGLNFLHFEHKDQSSIKTIALLLLSYSRKKSWNLHHYFNLQVFPSLWHAYSVRRPASSTLHWFFTFIVSGTSSDHSYS